MHKNIKGDVIFDYDDDDDDDDNDDDDDDYASWLVALM